MIRDTNSATDNSLTKKKKKKKKKKRGHNVNIWLASREDKDDVKCECCLVI